MYETVAVMYSVSSHRESLSIRLALKKKGDQLKNSPMGKKNLRKFLCRKPTRITHTNLFQEEVVAKQICAITKHTDERSLDHYIGQTTSAQKRHCSSILSTSFSESVLSDNGVVSGASIAVASQSPARSTIANVMHNCTVNVYNGVQPPIEIVPMPSVDFALLPSAIVPAHEDNHYHWVIYTITSLLL